MDIIRQIKSSKATFNSEKSKPEQVQLLDLTITPELLVSRHLKRRDIEGAPKTEFPRSSSDTILDYVHRWSKQETVRTYAIRRGAEADLSWTGQGISSSALESLPSLILQLTTQKESLSEAVTSSAQHLHAAADEVADYKEKNALLLSQNKFENITTLATLETKLKSARDRHSSKSAELDTVSDSLRAAGDALNYKCFPIVYTATQTLSAKLRTPADLDQIPEDLKKALDTLGHWCLSNGDTLERVFLAADKNHFDYDSWSPRPLSLEEIKEVQSKDSTPDSTFRHYSLIVSFNRIYLDANKIPLPRTGTVKSVPLTCAFVDTDANNKVCGNKKATRFNTTVLARYANRYPSEQMGAAFALPYCDTHGSLMLALGETFVAASKPEESEASGSTGQPSRNPTDPLTDAETLVLRTGKWGQKWSSLCVQCKGYLTKGATYASSMDYTGQVYRADFDPYDRVVCFSCGIDVQHFCECLKGAQRCNVKSVYKVCTGCSGSNPKHSDHNRVPPTSPAPSAPAKQSHEKKNSTALSPPPASIPLPEDEPQCICSLSKHSGRCNGAATRTTTVCDFCLDACGGQCLCGADHPESPIDTMYGSCPNVFKSTGAGSHICQSCIHDCQAGTCPVEIDGGRCGRKVIYGINCETHQCHGQAKIGKDTGYCPIPANATDKDYFEVCPYHTIKGSDTVLILESLSSPQALKLIDDSRKSKPSFHCIVDHCSGITHVPRTKCDKHTSSEVLGTCKSDDCLRLVRLDVEFCKEHNTKSTCMAYTCYTEVPRGSSYCGLHSDDTIALELQSDIDDVEPYRPTSPKGFAQSYQQITSVPLFGNSSPFDIFKGGPTPTASSARPVAAAKKKKSKSPSASSPHQTQQEQDPKDVLINNLSKQIAELTALVNDLRTEIKGLKGKGKEEIPVLSSKACQFEGGCTSIVKNKYCTVHNSAFRSNWAKTQSEKKTEDAKTDSGTKQKPSSLTQPKRLCQHDGCLVEVKRKFCPEHANRQTASGTIVPGPTLCQSPGCVNVAVKEGTCSDHIPNPITTKTVTDVDANRIRQAMGLPARKTKLDTLSPDERVQHLAATRLPKWAIRAFLEKGNAALRSIKKGELTAANFNQWFSSFSTSNPKANKLAALKEEWTKAKAKFSGVTLETNPTSQKGKDFLSEWRKLRLSEKKLLKAGGAKVLPAPKVTRAQPRQRRSGFTPPLRGPRTRPVPTSSQSGPMPWLEIFKVFATALAGKANS